MLLGHQLHLVRLTLDSVEFLKLGELLAVDDITELVFWWPCLFSLLTLLSQFSEVILDRWLAWLSLPVAVRWQLLAPLRLLHVLLFIKLLQMRQ